jgi:hypothetical protein
MVREPPCAAPTGAAGPAVAAAGADGRVLLLCGPAGVGKSTIGFQLYQRCLRAGLTAGYIDLDQIGFLRPPADNDPGSHGLKAGNLAAIWRIYHAAGATHLVATGPIEDRAALQTYVAALPSAAVTACRLHAGSDELRRRITTRGEGGSWPQPGDPLSGQPASYLAQAAEQAAADARALDRIHLDAIRIDTDGHTAAEAADLTAAATGWPGQGLGLRRVPDLRTVLELADRAGVPAPQTAITEGEGGRCRGAARRGPCGSPAPVLEPDCPVGSEACLR